MIIVVFTTLPPVFESEGIEMTSYGKSPSKGLDTSYLYLKQQELNLMQLLDQVGPGNTHARLLRQLRHTRACLALTAVHSTV